jgi:4-diphosphocytidyl-2-C-methyl-D-erythritol kinase
LAKFSPASTRVRAFAKINLGLKIAAKRPDGYHEIRTVYQTVALHDRLAISVRRGKDTIDLECSDPSIPSGHGNLVYRACELWRAAREFRGAISLQLEKRIPSGSGLGGASADAAATLLGLERLTGDRLSLAERFHLAAQLGSDVPFFLLGGRALGIGRGEEVYPLADLPRRHVLIVFPGFSVSTAVAYQEAGRLLKEELTNPARAFNIYFFGAWPHHPLQGWGPAENDFERVVFARWPELARLKRQLVRAGAEIASLTGSGSAVFGVFDSAPKLTRATALIPRRWQTYRTRALSRPEYLSAVTSGK